jgi:hypothetical protein
VVEVDLVGHQQDRKRRPGADFIKQFLQKFKGKNSKWPQYKFESFLYGLLYRLIP